MRNKFRIYSKKLLVVFVAFLLCSAAYAQEGVVSGKVSDASTGELLPGATVLIKGTSQGTTTDIDGNYKLTVEPNTTLVFSFVGYQQVERVVQPNTTVNVSLESSAKGLDEVVVIGYGVEKKEDATGSVTAVDADQFNKGAITSPQELIMGKVSGVQITTGGGAPGEGSTIRIRGGSSLSASNDPLIVVDGIPIDDAGIGGARNNLNVVNPNDIESVTVLKDASATAIYGSRASNGVIMITTKKAKAGDPLTVNYTGKFNMHVASKKIEVLTGDEFRQLIQERHPDQADMLGDANTDWQDEIYQDAAGMDHNLSVSGSYADLPFRLSVGYSDNDGILKTDNNKRTTGSLSLNPSFFDDHLKINANAKGSRIENVFANRDAIGAAIQYDPTKPVHSDARYSVPIGDDTINTDYGGYYAWLQANGQPVEQGSANPVALLNQRQDESEVNRFIGNVKLDYQFHFLPELSAVLNLGYDYSKSEGNIYVPQEAAYSYDPVHGGGVDNMYEQEHKNELLDFYLTYDKNLASISSHMKLMAGYSWQHFWHDNYSLNSNVANTPDQTQEFSDPAELYLISFFGRLNYSLKDKYLLTFTLRNDGTSRFSPDTRWGLFPSVALGWKMKKEAFLKDVDLISQMKMRLGWGVTGQQNIGGYYEYLPRYTYSLPGASYLLGGVPYRTIRPEGYDYNIKWEETTTYNVGLDYGFSNDRYYGSVDFYLRKTKDLLNWIPVPAGTNLTNYINTNIGDLENRGVEFTINTKPVITSDLQWELGMNATYNENEITKLTATQDPSYLGVPHGGIAGGVGNNIQIHTVGYPTSSFFVHEQVYDQNGDPIPGVFVDQNGDGIIDDEDKIHVEKPAPDVLLGITSGLSYKNWYFSFAGRANIGNFVYNNIDSENGNYQRLFRPEGPYLSNITTTVYNSNFVSPYYLSDYYLRDGSFFRMDNITLSYAFNNLIGEGSNLTVSATVNNAFVITNYEGIDPEISGGIDNRIYPRPTTYVLGVNLQF